MYNPCLTEKERTSMPKRLFGGEHYKVDLIDFDKYIPEFLEKRKGMNNVIELRCIKTYSHKEISKTIGSVKDPLSGINYGIPIGLHPDGNIKWQKIRLDEFMTFDLRKPEELKRWLVVRMHPNVDGSPIPTDDIIWNVYDPDVEARKETQGALLMAGAINKANKIPTKELLTFHRYLGLATPHDITPKRLRANIISFAAKESVEFENKYNDPNRKIYEIFHNAKATGLITYNQETGFYYKDTSLGMYDIEAIRFLSESTIHLTSLSKSLEKADTDQLKLETLKEEE